jgi:hypothetical protein
MHLNPWLELKRGNEKPFSNFCAGKPIVGKREVVIRCRGNTILKYQIVDYGELEMNLIKKAFINYTPIFLFLPVSLAIGLYCIREADVLLRHNGFPLIYYICLAAAPLYFIIFRVRQDFGQEVLEIAGKLPERLSKHKWFFLLIAIAFSIFFLYLATIHISTNRSERDFWILDNNVPVLPMDSPIPSRLALAVSLFTPTDLAVPLLNLSFVLMWFVFLIYVYAEENQHSIVVLLAFIATFFNGAIYIIMKADMDLPSALLSFIGLYGIWKGKFNLGLFLLVLGAVWKNTGIFQIGTGVILLAYLCWQARSFWKVISKIDIALLIFLAIFFIANQWGLFYYIAVIRGGPGYLVSPIPSQQIFWLTSFETFGQVLSRNYTLLLILGLIGGILVKKIRVFFWLSFGVLMFVRCFSTISGDGGYVMIFVPALSFFSLYGIGHMWDLFKSIWLKSLLVVLIVGLSVVTLIGTTLFYYSRDMTRLNSNFDEFVAYTAENFPVNGEIYQRNISLIPYLRNHGRSKADIIFNYYFGTKENVMAELIQPGCKLIIMERNDLGISEGDLTSIGFSDKPYTLRDDSGTWVVYSRDCK